MYILIWDPQRRPDFKKAIFSHFQLHCLDNLKREHCVCYRDATLTTDSPSFLSSSLSVRYPCYLVCFLALEGVQVNGPQQHSVADHIRCYFFWCETHSIKTHQSFPWSIFWRDTKGAAVLYQLGGVDELGWCVLPLIGSPERIYIKAWGKTVFVVVAQHMVRGACPVVAPDIWGPQKPWDDGYLNIVPLLEPASILLSFILLWGGKRFVLAFTFTPVHSPIICISFFHFLRCIFLLRCISPCLSLAG